MLIIAAIFVIFPFCMAFAAISDALSMTISNRLSATLFLSFLVIAPLAGMGWETFAWHLGAAALVLAVTFVLFAIGGMGGGDAKLLAATAVWMGFGTPLVQYLVYSAVAGGVLTLAILLYRRSPLSTLTGHIFFLKHFADQKEGIPYGIALAIGGLIAFPHTWLVEWAFSEMAR